MPGRRSLTTAGRPSGSTQACTWVSTGRTAARRRTRDSSPTAAPDPRRPPGAVLGGNAACRQGNAVGVLSASGTSGGGRHQLAQLHERRPEPAERGDRALRQRRVPPGPVRLSSARAPDRASQPGAGSVQRLGEVPQRSPASSRYPISTAHTTTIRAARPGRADQGRPGHGQRTGRRAVSERPGEPSVTVRSSAAQRGLRRRPRGAGRPRRGRGGNEQLGEEVSSSPGGSIKISRR